MNLKQLKYFVAAVEEGSLTRASRVLGVAQPALSQQILNLERSLGAQVLERFPSGVKPTDAGERLLRHARLILLQTEEARRDVTKAASDTSGEVKLALPPTVARLAIPPLLRELSTFHPGIRLNVIECDVMKCHEYIAEARVDFGITAKSLVGSDLHAISAFATPIYLVGSVDNGFEGHPTNDDIRLSDALTYPIAVHTRPHSLRVQIDDTMARRSMQADWYVESDSSSIIRHYVAAGVACAFLPAHAIGDVGLRRDLFARRIIDPEIIREYPICWSRHRPLSKAALVSRGLLEKVHNAPV